jgi:hypothetical protein
MEIEDEGKVEGTSGENLENGELQSMLDTALGCAYYYGKTQPKHFRMTQVHLTEMDRRWLVFTAYNRWP